MWKARAWGRIDEERLEAETHADRRPGDEELLERAAVETFTHGGVVYSVPSARVPGGGVIAAVLRY